MSNPLKNKLTKTRQTMLITSSSTFNNNIKIESKKTAKENSKLLTSTDISEFNRSTSTVNNLKSTFTLELGSSQFNFF